MTESIGQKNIALSEELIDKIDLNIFRYSKELKSVTFLGSFFRELNPDLRLQRSETWKETPASSTTLLHNELSQYLELMFHDRAIKEYGYKIFTEVLIANQFGEIVAANKKQSRLLCNNEEWWQKTMEHGSYYSDIKFDENTSSFGIEIAHSIRDENKTLGVIKGFLDISKLIEEARISWGSNSRVEIKVLTNSGEIIYSTNLYKFLDDYTSKHYFPKNKDSFNGYYINREDGYLYSYSVSDGYRNYDGFKWILIVSEKLNKALAPINQFSRKIYLYLLMIILLSIAGTLFIIYSIIKPLGKFKEGASEIASGNLNYLFIVDKNEELISLSNTFNDMVAKLKQSYQHIENKEKRAVKLSRELKISNQELEQFSYIASHDLKEPLRKIIAYGGLLSEEYSDYIDEQGQKYISIMGNSAQRMNDLLSNLLAYSRIESRGKEFLKISLNEVLDDVLSDLEIQIQETGTIITSQELPEIMGDKIQISQIFQNIISNAIKFVKPHQNPNISFSLVNTEGDNDYKIAIKDDGIGFDMQYRDEIFKPFKKLHSASEYAGTGIGLAICKKIIKRHHGYITVESTKGIGTTFFIHIPKIK
jgi:signal transduction histidine kinase